MGVKVVIKLGVKRIDMQWNLIVMRSMVLNQWLDQSVLLRRG
jgi:hypothetical protein